MLSHVVRELVSFEGLIDCLDQLSVLLDIPIFVYLVLDVKHPLAVVFELNEGVVDLPNPLVFIQTLSLSSKRSLIEDSEIILTFKSSNLIKSDVR
jgi:hypothetical protein